MCPGRSRRFWRWVSSLVKILGMALIVLCSTMIGMSLASNLSDRVKRIEESLALLGYLSDRLRYLQSPMSQLVEGAAAMERFSHLGFLRRCRDRMRGGAPFPEAWRVSVGEAERELGRELLEVLLPLGEVLGGADLDSQLASLLHAASLLESRLGDARANQQQHGKLYCSLGVLAGIAFVVILI